MEEDDSEIRPLPSPPRCRGIPLGNGDYTVCAYGYGDIPPFTGPGDCPTCNVTLLQRLGNRTERSGLKRAARAP